MFDLDELLSGCQAAVASDDPVRAVHEVLDRTLARPTEVADALGEPKGGLRLLHHAPDLTVLNVIWAPGMVLRPHNHRMWAAIGVYGGQEDNTFYRRDAAAGLTKSGGKELTARDVVLLGDATIHSVSNPRDHEFTGAIHVYGGDFVNQPRSQWDPETLQEEPYDIAEINATFEAANQAWAARQAAG